jgi:hypothetical protein
MQGLFGFGQNAYGVPAAPSAFNMGGLFSGFGFGSGFGASNSGYNSGSAGGGFNWKYFLIGLVAAAFIAVLLYFVVERADTRPVVAGFADLDAYTDVGDMNKPAEIAKEHPMKPAPAVPSEEHFLVRTGFEGGTLADTPLVRSTLYSAYAGRVSGQTDAPLMGSLARGSTASDALLELQQLEAKLAAFTADLTSPEKQINASKLVQYNTYQDIRPLGDWTAQCFSKNVPERDITLQMERWFLSGKKTLADLNKAAGQPEDTNVTKLASMIDTVKTVAMANCVARAHTDIDALGGPRDPAPYAGSAKTDTSSQFTPL